MRYITYNKQFNLFQLMESRADDKNPFVVCQIVIMAKNSVEKEMLEILKGGYE